MSRNKFITFEGGEGTGKSTTAIALQNRLEQMNIPSLRTWEPGGQDLELAEDIRSLIMKNGDIDPLTEVLLFQASRREHLSKIILPALAEDKVVICDRFTDSTLVYQGYVNGISLDVLDTMHSVIGVEAPAITFIFDLDPSIGAERIKKNQRTTNRFDNSEMEVHNKIREGFLDISKRKQEDRLYYILDATKSTDDLVDEIVEEIYRLEII